jgi:hypothetical protein
MALWAVVVGVPAIALAFLFGALVNIDVGASAAIGVAAVLASFCANALGLGWARKISVTAIQVVALSGFVVRLAFVIGVYAVLNATASWFVAGAFGGGLLAMLPLAGYEAYLARRGRVAELIVDADRAANAAARRKEPA